MGFHLNSTVGFLTLYKRLPAVLELLLGHDVHQQSDAEPQLRQGPREATKTCPEQVRLEDSRRVANDLRVTMLDQVLSCPDS